MKYSPLLFVLVLSLAGSTAAAQVAQAPSAEPVPVAPADASVAPAPGTVPAPAPVAEAPPVTAPPPVTAVPPAPVATPAAAPYANPGPSLQAAQPYALAPASAWSADDERWFRTNRRIAIAGKVITVVGRIATLATAIAGLTFEDPEYWIPQAVATSGELMWSIADLRATNRFSDRGVRMRRGAAVASVVGAVVFAPVTWIAGPIASARLRDAHDDVALRPGQATAASLDVRGASLTLKF